MYKYLNIIIKYTHTHIYINLPCYLAEQEYLSSNMLVAYCLFIHYNSLKVVLSKKTLMVGVFTWVTNLGIS